MPITTVNTFTCDGCNETLQQSDEFFFMQVNVNGPTPPPFGGIIVFCNTKCLQDFAGKLPAPTTGA